jgi:hypothetical protein
MPQALPENGRPDELKNFVNSFGFCTLFVIRNCKQHRQSNKNNDSRYLKFSERQHPLKGEPQPYDKLLRE